MFGVTAAAPDPTSGRLVGMRSEVITIRTGSRPVVRDLTAEVERFLAGAGAGLLHVFVPHATAGLAIIETGAGSDDDLLRALDDLLPTYESLSGIAVDPYIAVREAYIQYREARVKR